MVECDLAKVEVAGSTPVSRSISFDPRPGEGLLRSPTQGRGRQVVRPRSAKPLSAVRFRPAPPKQSASGQWSVAGKHLRGISRVSRACFKNVLRRSSVEARAFRPAKHAAPEKGL